MKRKFMMKTVLLAIIVTFVLVGCSAHNPFILKNTAELQNISKTKYPAHSRKIFVTEYNLPQTVKYEILGTIEVGKIWYGSSNNVMQSMADRAREIGADGVVEVQTWFQPSGWSWSAPHGSGIAVKIKEPEDFDWSALNGWWK